MNATTLPAKRDAAPVVEVTSQPLQMSPAAATRVRSRRPADLKQFRQNLWEATPLSRLSETDKCNPKAVEQAALLSAISLVDKHEQIHDLAEHIYKANSLYNVSHLDVSSEDLCASDLRQLRRLIPKVSLASTIKPSALRRFETAQTTMIGLIDRVAIDMARMLNYLSELGIVGRIQYLGVDVAEVTYGRPCVADREVSRTTSSDMTTRMRRGVLWHTETDTTTVTHEKLVESRSSLQMVIQRLITPKTCALPYRGAVPSRIRPLLQGVPEDLRSLTHVLTAESYEIRIDETLVREVLHATTEMETFHASRRTVNRETASAARTAATYAVLTAAGAAGTIAAGVAVAAAVSAVMAATAAAAPVAVPVAAAAGIMAAVSPDPAIIVDDHWCLSAWVPSELRTRSRS